MTPTTKRAAGLGLLVTAAVVAAGALAAVRPWAFTGGRRDPRRRPSDAASYTPAQGEPLVLADECGPAGRRSRPGDGDGDGDDELVVVGALGDLLIHNGPHRQGLAHGFASLWAPLAPLLAAADVTYANLEGSLGGRAAPGFGKGRSTEKNRLVYDPQLARALADAGLDVLSTANNHALDGGAAGVVATLDALDDARLAHTGTRRPGDRSSPWFTITETRGMRIAWLACSEWTNEREPGDDDSDGALVLHCHRHRDEVLALVRALAARPDVDAVIATPHGGRERWPRADRLTRTLAHDLIEAGAVAVVGNHPHALQQWEVVRTAAGREGVVSTCSGASFSAIRAGEARAGAFLLLGLGRGPDGKARLRAARHVPLVYERLGERFVLGPARASGTAAAARALERVLSLWSPWNEVAPVLPLRLSPACGPGAADGGADGAGTSAASGRSAGSGGSGPDVRIAPSPRSPDET